MKGKEQPTEHTDMVTGENEVKRTEVDTKLISIYAKLKTDIYANVFV